MRYAIVIEECAAGYEARVLDFPDCVVTGSSAAEARRLIDECIQDRVRTMRDTETPLPKPKALVDYVDV
ncbi:MAG: type II toxin-antitoxin system HicB family antitoxin [Bacteroidota bacterium]